MGIRHTLPKTVLFPDMNSYYEYYKFVTAMASHPEIDNVPEEPLPLRDVPMAVAYTPQEYDMILATAKRMGKKTQEIAFHGSHEPPGGNIESPVMKFNMFESEAEQIRSILEGIR
jgi:hypothetical protein